MAECFNCYGNGSVGFQGHHRQCFVCQGTGSVDDNIDHETLAPVKQETQEELWDDLALEFGKLQRMEENSWEWNRKILSESFTIKRKEQ